MQFLALLGMVLTIAGLAGLGWCIVQGLRIRRAGLPPAEIHARLHRLLALRAGTAFPLEAAAEARASLVRPVEDAAWARLIVAYLRQAAGRRRAAA